MTKLINNKSELTEAFERAIENNDEFIAVLVSDGDRVPEIIINQKYNFKTKLEYYNSAYDLSLEHRHAENIKIIDVCSGDSLAEIEHILLDKEINVYH